MRERLQRSSVLEVNSLLTTREDEVGTLSEAEDEAALVQQLTGTEADLYFVCGSPAEQRTVATAVERGVVIHLEPGGVPDVAYAVAERPIDLGDGDAAQLYCPSPIAAALTRLLEPLAEFDIAASVVVLRGASSVGGAALDELLEQTRALLSFSGEMPTESLKTQLAFNAVGGEPPADLDRELAALLPASPVSVRVLDLGIFHGVGLTLDLRHRGGGGGDDLAGEIARRLEDDPYLKIAGDTLVGTMDAAGSDSILLATPQTRPDGASLWAVFDNLTLAARNAVELAESLPDRWLKVN